MHIPVTPASSLKVSHNLRPHGEDARGRLLNSFVTIDMDYIETKPRNYFRLPLAIFFCPSEFLHSESQPDTYLEAQRSLGMTGLEPFAEILKPVIVQQGRVEVTTTRVKVRRAPDESLEFLFRMGRVKMDFKVADSGKMLRQMA